MPNFQVIAKVPFIPGHEAVGTVVKTGPEATLKAGDRYNAISDEKYVASWIIGLVLKTTFSAARVTRVMRIEVTSAPR